MTAPYDYRTECGPTTLAVLAGIERDEAAHLLWAHRGLWHDERRAAGAGTHGTTEHQLGDVLVRLGYDVEAWTGDGALIADPVIYRGLLSRLVHQRMGEVRRITRRTEADTVAAPTAGDALRAEPRRWGPTLTEWLERHQGGGWWAVSVTHDTGAHVLPTYGGTILVNADEQLAMYGEWQAYEALRIFKPQGA